jgi:predicted GTPase
VIDILLFTLHIPMVEQTTQQPSNEFSYLQQSKIIDMPDDLRAPFKEAALAGKEVQSRKFRVICMIGCTGHGKSTTANSVCGAEHFTTSSSTESETSSFDVVLTRWQNKQTEEPVIVIDTPGIGDSRNRDTKHIGMMVNGLKEIGYAHTFAIVLNY